VEAITLTGRQKKCQREKTLLGKDALDVR